MKRKVYYAHCIALYNTPQENRDVQMLVSLGFDVVNPNSPECQEGYKREGMEYFLRLASQCDAVAFRALPDGQIPAGVHKEAFSFLNSGKPVIELPHAFWSRQMSVEATKAYLAEVGQR